MRSFTGYAALALLVSLGISVGGCKNQEGAATELADGTGDEAEATAEAIDSNSVTPEAMVSPVEQSKGVKVEKATPERKHSK